jgi:hypothetical protein
MHPRRASPLRAPPADASSVAAAAARASASEMSAEVLSGMVRAGERERERLQARIDQLQRDGLERGAQYELQVRPNRTSVRAVVTHVLVD